MCLPHDNETFFWDMLPRFANLRTLDLHFINDYADAALETRALS